MKTIMIKSEFSDDYITRQAGERLRQMIIETIEKKEQLILDFYGLVIASTSFFDEGIAKLILFKISYDDYKKIIFIENINPRDQKVLEQVCKMRGFYNA